jgi:hypothetical protein
MSGEYVKSKQCMNCNGNLPLTEEYFHRDCNSGDGFRHMCKSCRNGKTSEVKQDALHDVHKRLEQKGISVLSQLSEGGSKLPHIAEVYQCMIEAFGGPKLLAQHTVACYFHPDTNQNTKQKILQMLVNMSGKVSDSGAISRDLDQVPTEELQKMLDGRMNEAIQQSLRIIQMPAGEEDVDVRQAAG